jgi:hypothetical protein
MTMFANRFKLLAIVALAMLVGACAMTTVRQHQDLSDIARDIETVVIVPPDVDIELVVFDGDNEVLKDQQDRIGAAILDIAAQRLTEEHLEVIEFDFETEMRQDEEFAFVVTQCVNAWDAAKEELYQVGMLSEEKKSEFRTTLGPVVNGIAEKTGADSVLLMHYVGMKKSAGVIAKDMATSILIGALTGSVAVQPTESAHIDVALVDAHGGHVLWSNRKLLTQVSPELARVALQELPDVTWETELYAEAQAAEVGVVEPAAVVPVSSSTEASVAAE